MTEIRSTGRAETCARVPDSSGQTWCLREEAQGVPLSGAHLRSPQNGCPDFLYLRHLALHLLLPLLAPQAPRLPQFPPSSSYTFYARLPCLSEAQAPEPAQGSPFLLTFHKGQENRLLPSAERK